MPWAMEQSSANLSRVFAHSGFFYVPIPTYVSGVMALGWASDQHNLATVNFDAIKDRVAHLELPMRWYTPMTHAGAFAEPPMLAALSRAG